MDNKSIMAKRIKELRKKAGYTQQEVAKMINLSRAAYSFYELGTKEPKIDTLRAIADIYKVSLDYLVGRYN